MDKKSERHLTETLDKLEKEIARLNSLKFAILKGLMYGVGTVVGATLFGGIILTILFNTFDSLESIPFVKKFVEKSEFVDLVEQSQEVRDERESE